MVATILGTAVGALVALIMGGSMSESELTLTVMMAIAALVGFLIGYVSDFIFMELAKSDAYVVGERLKQL